MISHQDLLEAVPNALKTVDLSSFGTPISGKVRDMVIRNDGSRILVTTDRVSAFDVVLGAIPFKGQVLNQLSAWWFDHVRDIVPNHVITMPDENVLIGREAQPLPVEVIVRGFITGVTKTSLWTLYANGDRHPYGIPLPDGLEKNDALPFPIITPTTKAEAGGHDERLTREEILDSGLIVPQLWAQIADVAVRLFTRGQEVARAAGLVLVDTKYEFGLIDGKLAVIDEIHTPDSSRYWTLSSVERNPRAPENFDKEFLREWFNAQGYSGDGPIPPMPPEFVAQVAARYIAAYEQLTGLEFKPGLQPASERIQKNLENYFNQP
jgi:phosphoribosylaminoimidazole-succinocarboxamide synthase